MIVQSLMIKDPFTISDRTSVQEAIHLMQDKSIRHLPVVDKSHRLVGWATLSDMKQGLLPAMVTGLSVADIMVKNPITLHPDDDVEVAARVIYEKKIGGMPVVDDDKKVVGVMTVTDLLNAFIKIMGMLTNGTRLDVNVGKEAQGFEKVSGIIRDQGGEIVSVGIASDVTDKRIHYFRLKKCLAEPIIKALDKEGYEVVSSSG
ncbi:MAG: CBS domain-containing protein [Deltaproteobacteria bacterium]|nr:CBS domain-containing protein [Deltaproteobacteria bacterium]